MIINIISSERQVGLHVHVTGRLSQSNVTVC